MIYTSHCYCLCTLSLGYLIIALGFQYHVMLMAPSFTSPFQDFLLHPVPHFQLPICKFCSGSSSACLRLNFSLVLPSPSLLVCASATLLSRSTTSISFLLFFFPYRQSPGLCLLPLQHRQGVTLAVTSLGEFSVPCSGNRPPCLLQLSIIWLSIITLRPSHLYPELYCQNHVLITQIT